MCIWMVACPYRSALYWTGDFTLPSPHIMCCLCVESIPAVCVESSWWLLLCNKVWLFALVMHQSWALQAKIGPVQDYIFRQRFLIAEILFMWCKNWHWQQNLWEGSENQKKIKELRLCWQNTFWPKPRDRKTCHLASNNTIHTVFAAGMQFTITFRSSKRKCSGTLVLKGQCFTLKLDISILTRCVKMVLHEGHWRRNVCFWEDTRSTSPECLIAICK